METQSSNIMDLITRATWREAVTYRDTWPHEYVVVQKDGQQDLLAGFCRRILQGEGVEGRFFHQSRQYLFLGDYKCWTMTDCTDIDPDDYPYSPSVEPRIVQTLGGIYGPHTGTWFQSIRETTSSTSSPAPRPTTAAFARPARQLGPSSLPTS